MFTVVGGPVLLINEKPHHGSHPRHLVAHARCTGGCHRQRGGANGSISAAHYATVRLLPIRDGRDETGPVIDLPRIDRHACGVDVFQQRLWSTAQIGAAHVGGHR